MAYIIDSMHLNYGYGINTIYPISVDKSTLDKTLFLPDKPLLKLSTWVQLLFTLQSQKSANIVHHQK